MPHHQRSSVHLTERDFIIAFKVMALIPPQGMCASRVGRDSGAHAWVLPCLLEKYGLWICLRMTKRQSSENSYIHAYQYQFEHNQLRNCPLDSQESLSVIKEQWNSH